MPDRKLRRLFLQHRAEEDEVLKAVLTRVEHPVRRSRSFRLLPFLSVLLCVCILFLCAAGYTALLFFREYREASDFFKENQLPSEGFSPLELCRIAADIREGEFSFSGTVELFHTLSVRLYGEPLRDESPQSLSVVWKYHQYLLRSLGTIRDASGARFSLLRTLVDGEYRTQISKYLDDTPLWTEILDYDFGKDADYVLYNGGIVLAGTVQEASAVSLGVVTAFSADGQKLWEQQTGPHTQYDRILLSDDRLFVFGSRGEDVSVAGAKKRKWYFCVSEYSMSGSLLQYREHLWGSALNVTDAALVDGRFFLKLEEESSSSRLISVTAEGDWSEPLLRMDEKECTVTDMLTILDNTWLSVQVPRLSEDVFLADFAALQAEYYAACEEAKTTFVRMPQEYDLRLRSLFASRYDAVLLSCDGDGNVSRLYEVQKASCDRVSSLQNEIDWSVYQVESAENADMTWNYAAQVRMREYSYSFRGGELLDREERRAVTRYYGAQTSENDN